MEQINKSVLLGENDSSSEFCVFCDYFDRCDTCDAFDYLGEDCLKCDLSSECRVQG